MDNGPVYVANAVATKVVGIVTSVTPIIIEFQPELTSAKYVKPAIPGLVYEATTYRTGSSSDRAFFAIGRRRDNNLNFVANNDHSNNNPNVWTLSKWREGFEPVQNCDKAVIHVDL